MAINKAIGLVQSTGDLSIPLHLRNAPTKLMQDLDYGKNYKYAHNYENNFIDQEFLPDEISGTKLYEPGNNVRENTFRTTLKNNWKKKYDY
jgi:putative ATPase